jgi:hypothetical protein
VTTEKCTYLLDALHRLCEDLRVLGILNIACILLERVTNIKD